MIMGGSSLFSELFLIATILLLSNINISATCISSEKQALLDFRKDLIDPSGRLSSWKDDADCCQWQGVVCGNKSGHVIQLRLPHPVEDYSPLGGTISHSLQNLTHLRFLDLSENDFGGIPIPSFFGSLKSLRYLNLSFAGFQGIIPYQLGNLSSLRTLSVGEMLASQSAIGELVLIVGAALQVDNLEWLVGLSNLEHLDLTFVDLSIASNWLEVINMIPSIVELHVSSCDVTHISQLIHTNFSSLTVLDLSWNHLGGSIPRWIFGLTALVSLDLNDNSLEGPLPQGSPWNLTSLIHLDLSNNYLNGSLPNELINLNNLVSLNLRENRLEDSPDRVWNLSSLTSLDLSYNGFSGFLPNLISTLTVVTSLSLGLNHFQGYIPGSIANISNLQYLDLSNNNLSSSLPSELFTLKDLITVDTSGNHLSGPIPSTVGNCTKLKFLRLGYNNLTVSKWLYNCTSLESLELLGIALSGLFPSNLVKLSSLVRLDVSHNQLTGTLPESLAQLSKLEDLYITDNLMEGIVSENLLDNLTSLHYFEASENSLTLKVSASWIPRAQFQALGLAYWKLGPQFPTWLRSQTYLSDLNLSSTGISDTIPPWLFNLTLAFIDLSHNQFHGGISHFLCEVKNEPQSLQYLDLQENSLSGEIPDCWMNYPAMKHINLNSNNFTGSIPRSLFYLEHLDYLKLSNNSLTGTIPLAL